MKCECCAETKVAKDLWWCEADGCHILICSLCRCTLHPQEHADFISPFSDLKGVEMIHSTLKCANFKRRMAFKQYFREAVGLAETVWDAETHLHGRIAAAFPSFHPTGVPNTSPDMTVERAAYIGQQLVPGSVPPDVLTRLENMGLDSMALLVSDLLKSPAKPEPPTSAASSTEPVDPKPAQRVQPLPPQKKTQPAVLKVEPASSAVTTGRNGKERLLVIGGKGRELQIESLFPAKQEAICLKDPVSGTFAVTSRSCGTLSVFVFGGGAKHNQSIRYNKKKEVTTVIPAGAATQNHIDGCGIAVRTEDGRAITFLCGGPKNKDESVSACERLEGGVWRPVPQMTAQRTKFALVQLGGFLYALGDRGKTVSHLRSVERLHIQDPEKGWSRINSLPDLPIRLHSHAGAAFDGLLFVAGGIASDSDKPVKMSLFSMPGCAWETGPPLNYARCGHGLVVLDGRLYAVGGEGDGSVSKTDVAHSVEVLSEQKHKWILLPERTSLPMVQSAFAVI